MDFIKYLCFAVLVSAIISCKKDEATSITPTLDGTIKIMGLPEFIKPGESVTLTPRGVKHPDGGDIGYCWKVSPSQTSYDTTEVFKHTFSDTLRTYTIYCYAFASGYSTTSASSYTTTVAPGYNGSISGTKFNKIADDSLFVRHMPYYYKTIGTQTWTLNNMAVRSGKPFRNAEVMSEVFGRYYNFSEAKAACDSLDRDGQNWELPDMNDWAELEAYLSGETGDGKAYGKSIAASLMVTAAFNGTNMWDYWPEIGDITNASGFSALSTGYCNTMAGNFDGEFEYATFWTSEEANQTEGYYKYIIGDQPGIFTAKGDKASFGASVRCIRK